MELDLVPRRCTPQEMSHAIILEEIQGGAGRIPNCTRRWRQVHRRSYSARTKMEPEPSIET